MHRPTSARYGAAMSLRTRFFALTYDRQMARTEQAGLHACAERRLASTSGDVLEIGGGTGANLACYGPAVTTLTITEPQPPMLRRLEASARSRWPSARILRAPAEDLPFDDGSFDVAVSTLVLCGVDDQPQALRELRRVLRPGGRLLFMEHVRAEDGERLARWQDRMRPIGVRMAHGCRCNRRTVDGIRNAGFELLDLERDEMKHVPPFVRPLVVGAAATRVGNAVGAAGA